MFTATPLMSSLLEFSTTTLKSAASRCGITSARTTCSRFDASSHTGAVMPSYSHQSE